MKIGYSLELVGDPIRIEGLGALASVDALENLMRDHPGQIAIVPRHAFAQGLYAREVTLPEGSTAVGYRHRQSHVCIISKGRALIVAEDGVTEVAAPCTMIVPAGRKNCVHALEETVWTTIHAAESQNVAELEAMLVEGGEALEAQRVLA
jgi:hypothetical protein